MCGIAGLFLARNARADRLNLDRMLATLNHRGPDGRNQYTSADKRFQAGFTRLAIIDLETGNQPIVEGDGRRVLLGNGEIYNYVELRNQYADYPYRSVGDMETILPIVARRGDEFVHELNGIYSLALYERTEHRLRLVRDRLGVKPLYWAKVDGGGILFASEIKAIFASGLVTPAVDETAVNAYLAHGYVPAPQTLFRRINKLPPGHILRADATGRIDVECYWRPSPATDAPPDAQGFREQLTELLRDSVRLQLRSDVPIGALLSGGIDSGLVVALAAQQSAQPITTYTVRFEGAKVDETPLAAKVAERYATNHNEIDVAATEVSALLPQLAWFADEPLNDPALLPNFLIERELGRHLKVALNGTGGDELFAGYGRYFLAPVEQRFLKIPRDIRHMFTGGLARRLAPDLAWKLARAEKFDGNRGAYLHDHTTQFPQSIRTLVGNRMTCPVDAQSSFFEQFDGPPQSAALAADLSTYLSEDLLPLLDRTSMAAGVEGRVPFLDHRLVQLALAVPPDIRTPNDEQKALERAIAEPFLPHEILTAPKQGFASPVPTWLQAGLGTLARRILTRPETLDRGWWSADGIGRLLAQPHRHGFRIYTLLMLELAVRVHVEDAATFNPPSDGLEHYADAA